MVRRCVVTFIYLFFTAARAIESADFRGYGEVGPVLNSGMVLLSAYCWPASGCRRKTVAAGTTLPSCVGVRGVCRRGRECYQSESGVQVMNYNIRSWSLSGAADVFVCPFQSQTYTRTMWLRAVHSCRFRCMCFFPPFPPSKFTGTLDSYATIYSYLTI